MRNSKQAISLILLVITVIVMIILVGAIILTLNNVGIIPQAENAVDETNLEEVQAMYESVKEYKGFYIARYEAGLDVGSYKTVDDGVIIKAVHSKK